MKVIHWNISKEKHPMYATRKYEDELYKNIISLRNDLLMERIKRSQNRIFGNTFFSWIFSYNCKDADIVHATFQTVAPAVYFKKPRKFIVTVHDLAPLVYPFEINDISMRIQWNFTPKALRKADRIIAISEFTKRELVRLTGIAEEKISVVHQGVDHEKYKPMDKIKCKEKFGLNPEEKYILVVSSNLEHKRMDLAKKISNYIKSLREDIKMIKAGYGEQLKGEGIISIDWVPDEDMPILFNAADVYLHTSEYEGFGLPILEAMACGVPIVANNKASMPEIVGNYGLVDLDDNIIQTSEKLLSLIEKGLNREAIEQCKKFSWRKTAEETIKIYEDVYKENKR